MTPVSPFAPSTFPSLASIRGLSFATASLEGRYHPRDNLLVARFDTPAATPANTPATLAGVTTRSSIVGAPVVRARSAIQQGLIKGLIVNAGNANTCTGTQGVNALSAVCASLAQTLECPENQVLMASTGVIGEQLDPSPFCHAFPLLSFNPPNTPSPSLSPSLWEKAATAIMTTDTFPKGSTRSLTLENNTYALSGIAKGSGMVAPHMATMLAFLFTDVSLPASRLQHLLEKAVEGSFNAITVDGDTSTSDMVLLISTGQSPTLSAHQELLFSEHLQSLCHDLALQIVGDGEGASKIISVHVRQARTQEEAKIFARSVASSPLVKTAVHGGDLNWGRIAMALGKTFIPLEGDRISILIGDRPLYQQGKVCHNHVDFCEKHVKENRVSITVELSLGHAEATVYASDLTHGYVDINAHYRS
jgi:glutamate N-acetyltransferase/amino-acid N-acetyltransferase